MILDEETLGTNASVEEFVKNNTPESLEEARARLLEDCALTEDLANVIAADPPTIALFELTVETARKRILLADGEGSRIFDKLPTMSANWPCNNLFAHVKRRAAKGSENADEDDEGSIANPVSVEHSTVDGNRLRALVAMVAKTKLTPSMGKKILAVMFEEDHHKCSSTSDIARDRGWRVLSDMGALVGLCEDVVCNPWNALQMEQYGLGGKEKKKTSADVTPV